MLKKLKDNPVAISVLFLAVTILLFFLIRNKFNILLCAGVLVAGILLFLRFLRASFKKRLEYLDGPGRFCKGTGIEIGSGGKHMVKGSLLVDIVDDFSHATPYKVDYIADAHDLPKIDAASLDYVCASHVLEHLTDPIKAILEWSRVLKPGGIIWLRIPDKRKTFDRNRERTQLSHLIEDFIRKVPVDDPTHIDDNNRNTVPPRNQGHPYIHNHVWIPEDIRELFIYINEHHTALSIEEIKESSRKNAEDFYIVAKKQGAARER